jgi:hypothetical protein
VSALWLSACSGLLGIEDPELEHDAAVDAKIVPDASKDSVSEKIEAEASPPDVVEEPKACVCLACGCSCADHQCAGGNCPGSGCTAKETSNCANYTCGCQNHGWTRRGVSLKDVTISAPRTGAC